MQEKQGIGWLNKKIIGALLIALLAITLAVSLSYAVSSQLPQTKNSPSQTPLTTPESTPTLPPVEEQNKPVSIPKPSIPEFTVEFVDYSYDVPPSYSTSTNPYTGEITNKTTAGYHVDNRTVKFTIKNQPFTSYKDVCGNNIEMYYNFRAKGYYTDEWDSYPFFPNNNSMGNCPIYPASTTGYTVILMSLNSFLGGLRLIDVPERGRVDLQVQALTGYTDLRTNGIPGTFHTEYYTFTGEKSDWSQTLTLTFPLF